MTLTQITEKGIKDGEIVNADINASAAIAKSKLASLDIVNGDINSSAAIARSKVADFVEDNVNDRVLTATGTANTLQAESKLLFTSSGGDPVLTIQGSSTAGHAQLNLKTGGTTDHGSINFGDNDDDDAGEIRYTHSSNLLQFDTAGSPRMVIDSDGKVGIGTTSPTAPLTVHNSNDTTTNALEVFNDNGVRVSGFSQSSAGDGTLDLRTNAPLQTVLLRSNGDSHFSGGNVGIGITAPSFPLDVRGNNNTVFDHVGTMQLVGFSAYDSGDSGSGINFGGKYNSSGSLTTFAQISGIKADGGNGSYDGAITFGVRNDTSGMGLDIERLRIDHDGNLKLRNVTNAHQAIQFYKNNDLGCSFSYGEGNANPTLNIYRADAQTGYPYGNLIINTGHGTTPTQALKLRTDKNIELAGNLIMAEYKGIQFHDYGTGTNIDNNLLDDYEEGTWTPVLKSGNNTISYTSGSPQFRYTKIGNTVYVNFTSGGTTTSGTTGGDFSIEGLPFTSIASSRHIGSIINNWGAGMQLSSNFVYIHLNSAHTTIHPYSKSTSSSGGNYGHVDVTGVGNSTHMQWSLVYQAA